MNKKILIYYILNKADKDIVSTINDRLAKIEHIVDGITNLDLEDSANQSHSK